MAETATACTRWPASTWPSTARGPSHHVARASCSKRPPGPSNNRLATRARWTTWPFSSTTTAFTDVVPTSTPATSGEELADEVDWDAAGILRHYGRHAIPIRFLGARDHRALVTAPMRGPGLDKLARLVDVVHEPWIDQVPLRVYDGPALAERLRSAGADIAVVEADFVNGPVWDLPLVAVAATRGDPNNVDVAAATAAGVPVLRTPGRNADAVAELAIGLLIAIARRVLPADADVREMEVFRDGTIPYQRFRGWELAGQRAAIIGYGAVGRALEWRLRGLGLEVEVYDPYVEGAGADLHAVVARADVVSLHAAMTAETIGMFGKEQFSWMRPGSVFLNTARAKLHDMDALVAALESGQLAGAGLDHFEGEQLPAGHPLLSMANVVLTPHIGGATTDTEARGAQMVADDLERLLAGGTPLHIVNPEVLTAREREGRKTEDRKSEERKSEGDDGEGQP